MARQGYRCSSGATLPNYTVIKRAGRNTAPQKEEMRETPTEVHFTNKIITETQRQDKYKQVAVDQNHWQDRADTVRRDKRHHRPRWAALI